MDGSESQHVASPPVPVGAPARPRRSFGRKQLAIALGVWAALVVAALGIAKALDDEPVRATAESVAPAGLPPLRLYLDRSFPKEITDLTTLAAQADRLQELAVGGNDPARWVELGTVALRAGDLNTARLVFERALTLDRDRLEAKVGQAMVDGATGPNGLERAAKTLTDLERANPNSQLTVFNLGMVAAYRGDRDALERAFTRAAALGPDTPLGALARQLVAAASGASATP
jgi:tetratricopeptide (TPR) repeat protein